MSALELHNRVNEKYTKWAEKNKTKMKVIFQIGSWLYELHWNTPLCLHPPSAFPGGLFCGKQYRCWSFSPRPSCRRALQSAGNEPTHSIDGNLWAALNEVTANCFLTLHNPEKNHETDLPIVNWSLNNRGNWRTHIALRCNCCCNRW